MSTSFVDHGVDEATPSMLELDGAERERLAEGDRRLAARGEPMHVDNDAAAVEAWNASVAEEVRAERDALQLQFRMNAWERDRVWFAPSEARDRARDEFIAAEPQHLQQTARELYDPARDELNRYADAGDRDGFDRLRATVWPAGMDDDRARNRGKSGPWDGLYPGANRGRGVQMPEGAPGAVDPRTHERQTTHHTDRGAER